MNTLTTKRIIPPIGGIVAHDGQRSATDNGLWKIEKDLQPPTPGRPPQEETQKRLRKITMFFNMMHKNECFMFDSISKEQVHRHLKKTLELNNGVDYRITIANKEKRWYRLWKL